MTKTILIGNLLTEDSDLLETIEDDQASKISGGFTCTEENRTILLDAFQITGFLSDEQVNAIEIIPLEDFCSGVSILRDSLG